MGGPMNYARLVSRNGFVWWGYRAKEGDPICDNIYDLSGEFRRMEEDQLGAAEDYAKQAGITTEQAEIVLRTFLGIPEPGCQECNKHYSWQHGANVNLGRCGKHLVYGKSYIK